MVRKQELGLFQGPVVNIYTIIKLGVEGDQVQQSKVRQNQQMRTTAYFEFDFQHSRAFKARVLIL